MLKSRIARLSAVFMLLVLVVTPALTNATPLDQAGVRLGRLGISASTGNDLFVTTNFNTNLTNVNKVRVTFPAGFTVTTGTPAVGSTGFPATPAATGLPGTLSGASTAGSRTIVVSGITGASLVGATLYGFTIPTGIVTNHATAGQYTVTVESLTSGDVLIDNSDVPVYIYGGASNADQVTVNASVASSFSFSLSANTDTVPKADPTNIFTSPGVNMVVGTNSALGYTAYVKSANGLLNSAAASSTIPTLTFGGGPDAVAAGTASYTFVPSTGALCGTCSGSLTYDTEYNGITGSSGGSFNGTNFASFVSRSGYTNADTISLKERVAVSTTTPAANDYTDTLTIVAAGNF